MNSMDEQNELNLVPLNNETVNTAQSILNATSLEETQKLVKLFNLTQAKKNVIRVMKLNELLDNVQDEMIDRFEKYPDEFTNGDLLNYFQVTQSAIDRANKSLNLVDEIPAIQINQVNVVNDTQTLTREERNNVLDFISQVLGNKIKKESQEESQEDIIEIDTQLHEET